MISRPAMMETEARRVTDASKPVRARWLVPDAATALVAGGVPLGAVVAGAVGPGTVVAGVTVVGVAADVGVVEGEAVVDEAPGVVDEAPGVVVEVVAPGVDVAGPGDAPGDRLEPPTKAKETAPATSMTTAAPKMPKRVVAGAATGRLYCPHGPRPRRLSDQTRVSTRATGNDVVDRARHRGAVQVGGAGPRRPA
jgi:hypothetical protein